MNYFITFYIVLHFNNDFVFFSLGKYGDTIVYIVLAVAILALVLMFIHRWKESSKMDSSQEVTHESRHIITRNKAIKKDINLKKKNNLHIDLKLQAYERLTIFLSRIDPWRLLSLVKISEKNIKEIENSLLSIIVSEFEYNLSQQVYISDNLWQLIETSKNRTIELILSVKQGLGKNASGQDFYNHLESILKTQTVTPSKITIDYLKKEVRDI